MQVPCKHLKTASEVQLTSHSNSAGWVLKIVQEGPWIRPWKLKENRVTLIHPKQLTVIITGLLLASAVVTCSETIQRGICSTPGAVLLAGRASPERDTWSLCVLLSFRRAKLGRKAVEYGTSVPVTLPFKMDDGSTQMPLALKPQTYSVCAKRGWLDLSFLPGQTTLSQHS